MEEIVRAILKDKGLKMSDLANRVGMGQSNLVASLRANPTLSTLEDICLALGIELADLFGRKEEKSAGVVFLNGETFVVERPRNRTVQLPIYANYSVLRDNLKAFIKTSIKKQKPGSICGMVEDFEFFTLSYDYDSQTGENKPPYDRFTLTVCYGNKQIWVCQFDLLEYNIVNKELQWDIPQVTEDIINDIEGYALGKLNKDYKYIVKEA